MTGGTYMRVSATIFAVVALAHALRLAGQVSFRIGSVEIPMIISWGGVIVPALLSCWGFAAARGKTAA